MVDPLTGDIDEGTGEIFKLAKQRKDDPSSLPGVLDTSRSSKTFDTIRKRAHFRLRSMTWLGIHRLTDSILLSSRRPDQGSRLKDRQCQ
jgi:hypothetical protein